MPRLLPLVALVLLAGCGQKGPLYLPAAPASAAPAAADGAPAAGAAASPESESESESRERALPAAQP